MAEAAGAPVVNLAFPTVRNTAVFGRRNILQVETLASAAERAGDASKRVSDPQPTNATVVSADRIARPTGTCLLYTSPSPRDS